MLKVLCIGDVMLDVIALVPAAITYGSDNPSQVSTHSGGAAGNVASWIKASGIDSHVVARVGNDAAGIAVLADLDHLGVTHSSEVIDGVRTGVVVILVDPSGERTMFPETAANAGLSVSDLPDLDGFGAVYLSGYALLNGQSRPGVLEMISEIARRNLPIFFDPTTIGGMNQASIEEVRGWLSMMDTLIMNAEEALFLAGHENVEEALELLLAYSPTVVIKRGSLGAIGKSRNSHSISLPAISAQLVDSTGAGDSFAGGYIAQWLRDRDLEKCMGAGIRVAATCVAIVGARPHVTTVI
ncbi:MAG: carbohydrate kinase family protein [Streptomycetaceae bacterium]|nr:MAG: carbohydrate kinase family protein [Streptomycetaceae bacterium]